MTKIMNTLLAVGAWLLVAGTLVMGFLQWLSWLVFHYTTGQWLMVVIDIIFCEILIPIMGLVRLFFLIF